MELALSKHLLLESKDTEMKTAETKPHPSLFLTLYQLPSLSSSSYSSPYQSNINALIICEPHTWCTQKLTKTLKKTAKTLIAAT